jgi:hypothetical protein
MVCRVFTPYERELRTVLCYREDIRNIEWQHYVLVWGSSRPCSVVHGSFFACWGGVNVADNVFWSYVAGMWVCDGVVRSFGGIFYTYMMLTFCRY